MSLTAGALAGLTVQAREFQQRAKAAAKASAVAATSPASNDRVSLSKLAESALVARPKQSDEKEALQNDIMLRSLLAEIKYARIPLQRRRALIARAVATWPDLADKKKDDFVLLIRLQIQNEERAKHTDLDKDDLRKLDEYIDEQLGIEKPAELAMIDSAGTV